MDLEIEDKSLKKYVYAVYILQALAFMAGSWAKRFGGC